VTPTFSSERPELNDEGYVTALQVARKRIVDFARAKVGQETAEDIAQECLLLLMERYPHVRDVTSIIKLTVTIARNKLFEHFRHAQRHEEFAEATPDTTDMHRDLERQQVVNRILPSVLQLGERCRSLLTMKLFEEKTAADIQQAMNVKSINTIYTWERRCFQQLLDLVGGTLYGRTTP
jgi:RNA polymerase sigma-70 factor (ECF subfamily)